MADRISSLDDEYVSGDLSIYPEAIDSFDTTLYLSKNNSSTVLVHSLSYNSNIILVEDTSKFADNGLVKIGDEIIYYAEKATGVFKDLKRGFAGSQQNRWPINTEVLGSVFAEHHNVAKDAVINIQNFLGTSVSPDAASFNGRLTALEKKFLSPKPLFRAFPRLGAPPLKVRFQNFSSNEAVRFLWDFGNGVQSTEQNPTVTFLAEGLYTVELRMITNLGGHGIVTKRGYIEVREDRGLVFMYVTPEIGTTSTTFEFIDQTDGEIIRRHWNFGDGTGTVTIDDPNVHTITHTYSEAGEYAPTLLIVFSDQKTRRVNLTDNIIVS